MIVNVKYPVPHPESVTITMSFEEARDLYEALSALGLAQRMPEPLYRVFHALIRSSVPRKVGGV